MKLLFLHLIYLNLEMHLPAGSAKFMAALLKKMKFSVS